MMVVTSNHGYKKIHGAVIQILVLNCHQFGLLSPAISARITDKSQVLVDML